MTAANLSAWFMQATVLISAVLVATRCLRIRHPRTELYMLHGVLAATVCLPLAQPRPAPIPPPRIFVGAFPTNPDEAAPAAAANALPGLGQNWDKLITNLFAGGCALRLIWLLAGVIRLRQYRRSASPCAPDFAAEDLTRAAAEFRVCERVGTPATYGWWRPVVLAPAKFLELREDQRRAIACHELLHVKRRDWLMCIAEEVALAGLWWQPAVWLLMRRIRRVREQVVDAAAVALTGDRRQYVEALIAMSGAHVCSGAAPAFARKRDLFDRIARLMEESPVSKPALISTTCFTVVVAVAAVMLSIAAFPMIAAPPAAQGAVLRVDVPGVPSELLPQVKKIVDTLPGKSFGPSTVTEVRSALQGIDARLEPHWVEERPGVFSLSIGFRDGKPTAAPTVAHIDSSRLPQGIRNRVDTALLPFLHQPFGEPVLSGINPILSSIDTKIGVRWSFHSTGALSLILVYDLPADGWQPVHGVLGRIDTSQLSPELRSRFDTVASKYVNVALTNASRNEIARELHAVLKDIGLYWKNESADVTSLTLVGR